MNLKTILQSMIFFVIISTLLFLTSARCEDAPAVTVALNFDKDEYTLTTKWPTLPPIAVFQKNHSLWMLVNAPYSYDLGDTEKTINGLSKKGITKIESINENAVSGLRLEHGRNLFPSLIQKDSTYVLKLSPQESPSRPLNLDVHLSKEKGASLLVKSPFTGGQSSLEGGLVKKLGPLKELTDSDGQKYWVVFSTFIGRGIPKRQEYVDFTLQSSVQGLAIIPIADSVNAREVIGGIEITKKDGLHLSPQLAMAQDAPGASPTEYTNFLYNFEKWAATDLGNSFIERKQSIQQMLVKTQDKNERDRLYLKLAQLYLSEGLGLEAEGLLDQIEFSTPDIAKDRIFISLRAFAEILKGKTESARPILGGEAYTQHTDQPLWVGYLAAKQEDWPTARAEFMKKSQLSEGCPRVLLFDLKIQWARALLTESPNIAKQQLKEASEIAFTPSQRDEADYYLGEVNYKLDKKEAAIKLWKKVAHGTSLIPQALARFALITNDDKNKLSAKKKIDELQRLSFGLRSGTHEAHILEKLGNIYFENGDYRQGFNAWKKVISQQPQSPKAAELTKSMAAKFEEIFLDDKVTIPPLAAATLFEEFKELTPSGPNGDKIIENLTNKLISIELLKDASRILEHQVRFRLQGTDKAKEGLKLAALYASDNNPEKALCALERSYAENLPSAVVKERQYLKATLINKLGEPTKALEILDKDDTYRGNRLRGDILWQAGRWDEAAAMYKKVVDHLEGQYQKKKKDDPELAKLRGKLQKNTLNLALAYSLAGQKEALQNLRTKYTDLMKEPPLEKDFSLATFGFTKGIRSLKQATTELENLGEYLKLINSIKAV